MDVTRFRRILERRQHERIEAALKEMRQSGCSVFDPPLSFGEYIHICTCRENYSLREFEIPVLV